MSLARIIKRNRAKQKLEGSPKTSELLKKDTPSYNERRRARTGELSGRQRIIARKKRLGQKK